MNNTENMVRARVIAFYLPQFHPVETNDKYWGKGFTEWRNVVTARPLFKGHYQPKLPADLGFYDLRIPEVREKQAELAKEAGVEGFCYWHYWFGNGEEVLERPLDEVTRSKKPDFPFCIGWANHSWKTTTWTKNNTGQEDVCIFEQKYLGQEDDILHFNRLLETFKDPRYIKVEGKLLFVIYDIKSFTNFLDFKDHWNKLALENGLKGFYFVSHTSSFGQTSMKNLKNIDLELKKSIKEPLTLGADGVEILNMKYSEFKAKGVFHKMYASVLRKVLKNRYIEKYDFRQIIKYSVPYGIEHKNVFPEIIDGNDRSPRAGRRAIIYYNVTPDAFYDEAKMVIDAVQNKDFDHRLVFLNSWNEWGEGMYMEPDLKYGKGFIHSLRKALEYGGE